MKRALSTKIERRARKKLQKIWVSAEEDKLSLENDLFRRASSLTFKINKDLWKNKIVYLLKPILRKHMLQTAWLKHNYSMFTSNLFSFRVLIREPLANVTTTARSIRHCVSKTNGNCSSQVDYCKQTCVSRRLENSRGFAHLQMFCPSISKTSPTVEELAFSLIRPRSLKSYCSKSFMLLQKMSCLIINTDGFKSGLQQPRFVSWMKSFPVEQWNSFNTLRRLLEDFRCSVSWWTLGKTLLRGIYTLNESYLTNRRQRVRVEGFLSEKISGQSGVVSPQGPCSVLFIFFIINLSL